MAEKLISIKMNYPPVRLALDRLVLHKVVNCCCPAGQGLYGHFGMFSLLTVLLSSAAERNVSSLFFRLKREEREKMNLVKKKDTLLHLSSTLIHCLFSMNGRCINIPYRNPYTYTMPDEYIALDRRNSWAYCPITNT